MVAINKDKVFKYMSSLDNEFPIACIINKIFQETTHRVSPQTSCEIVIAHGKNSSPDTSGDSGQQIMQLPEGLDYENLPTTNSIDSVISDSSSDNREVYIYGQTVDSEGNFSKEFMQSVTMDGTTEVTLPTPVARANRLINNSQYNLSGCVYVYESGITFTNGEPSTKNKVHLMSRPLTEGTSEQNNSCEKAAVCIPSGYYGIIKNVHVAMNRSSNTNFIDGELQIRKKDSVFITKLSITRGNSANTQIEDYPFIYAPPNSDVRLVSQINNPASSEVVGGIIMILAPIIQ